jgi:hypothetical protein
MFVVTFFDARVAILRYCSSSRQGIVVGCCWLLLLICSTSAEPASKIWPSTCLNTRL